MAKFTFTFDLRNTDETADFAKRLAKRAVIGDTILLNGPVGAGKTHFARSFIKALLIADEDVPSPTFTLVQTYETSIGEIWHADLYRLNAENEIEELGLVDAMTDAICLIEWPDRLGSYCPSNALQLDFQPLEDLNKRALTAHWSDPKWTEKTEGLQNV